MEWRHYPTKPHRLPPEAYFGDRAIVVTACIEDRLRPFQSPEITRECIEILKAATAKEKCLCSLYVFMPDHLHLILRGKEPESSIMNCLKRFKQSSGFLLSKKGYRWQKGFYDRAVQSPQEMREQIRYLIANPVRAGLVEYPMDWPFTGSLTADLAEILSEL